MFRLMDKKIMAIYRLKNLLNWPFDHCQILVRTKQQLSEVTRGKLHIFYKANLCPRFFGQQIPMGFQTHIGGAPINASVSVLMMLFMSF